MNYPPFFTTIYANQIEGNAMNPDYKELLGILDLHCCMNQEHVDHMLRTLVEKGWTITRIENLKESAK